MQTNPSASTHVTVSRSLFPAESTYLHTDTRVEACTYVHIKYDMLCMY